MPWLRRMLSRQLSYTTRPALKRRLHIGELFLFFPPLGIVRSYSHSLPRLILHCTSIIQTSNTTLIAMVRRAEEESKRFLFSRMDMRLRRFSALILIITLYTVATADIHGFAPATWASRTSGAGFLDAFFAPVILLAACFFQWRVSGVTSAVIISDFDGAVIIYAPRDYWKWAVGEFALLIGTKMLWLLLMVQSIPAVQGIAWLIYIADKIAVLVVVAVLWKVGWETTPQAWKREAWEYLKIWWLTMVFDEGRRVVRRRY
jgi:hypothetical protein